MKFSNAAQNYAREDFEGRRTILQGFGSIFLIRDRKLKMQPHEWLVMIDKGHKELEKEFLNLEPVERACQSGESAALDSICLRCREGFTLTSIKSKLDLS
ncbi:MAG: hypothetical protein ACI9QC_000631 [Oceanicoccus sp.]|jgi:hypothetical protein